MRYWLLFLLCPLLISPGQARDFDWVIVEPLDIDTNPALLQSSLAVNSSGDPVRASLVQNRAIVGLHYMGDFRIDHYDADGTVIWSGLLQGKVHVKDLVCDANDAIVVHGSYRDTVWVDEEHHLLDAGGSSREYLLKLGADHEVDWLIDTASIVPDLHGTEALAVDASGQIWIGSTQLGQNSTIHRLDSDGVVTATYTQTDVFTVTGLAVDPDGTVWATGAASTGELFFNGLSATGPFTYSSYLVKYAPGGAGAWVRFVEDITFQEPQLASDGTGHVYFAGRLFDAFAFGDLMPEGVDWVYDFFLTKVDGDGEFLWLREVPADGLLGDATVGEASFLSCPDDGSVTFAGFSRGEVDWGGDGIIPPDYGSRDVLVIQYSADGEFRWAKTAGGAGLDIADAVDVDASGNVFITGQVSEGAEFDDQVFGGAFVNSYIASLPAGDATAAEEIPFPASLVRIHPNPFNPRTQISYRLDAPTAISIRVYDLQGALVATLTEGQRDPGEYSVVWDGRDHAGQLLGSGVYLCRLQTERRAVTLRMVMIR